MTRLFLASIVGVIVFAVGPHAVNAQKPAPKKGDAPKSNQVYVKIILPIEPAAKRDAGRPVVESWIAEDLKKRGQSKFTAATGWVRLDVKKWEATPVWDGQLDGKQCNCPVHGDIPERVDGRIKVLLNGWAPFYVEVVVSLKDEPGSRTIAAVEKAKTDDGMPYVVVLIGPPPEKPAASGEQKK